MSDQFISEVLKAWWERAEIPYRSGAGRDYVYASGWKPCALAMFREVRSPEQAFSETSLDNMFRGRLLESLLFEQLMGICRKIGGVISRNQERVSIADQPARDGTSGELITGKIDGVLASPDGDKRVLEIKTGKIARSIACLADFSSSVWGRAYLAQMSVYMQALQMDGLFILEGNGAIPRLIEVNRDDHEVISAYGDFFEKATEVKAALSGDNASLSVGKSYCRYCRFRSDCPEASGGTADAQVPIEDIDDKVDELMALEPQHRRYLKINDEIKKLCRGRDLVAGQKYQITGKWSRRRVPKIPDDVRDEYLVTQEYWTMAIKEKEA